MEGEVSVVWKEDGCGQGRTFLSALKQPSGQTPHTDSFSCSEQARLDVFKKSKERLREEAESVKSFPELSILLKSPTGHFTLWRWR